MSEQHNAAHQSSLESFNTYEDYLDSLISSQDRYYLEEDELARQLIEIGSRKADVLSREEFLAKKQALEDVKRNQTEFRQQVIHD